MQLLEAFESFHQVLALVALKQVPLPTRQVAGGTLGLDDARPFQGVAHAVTASSHGVTAPFLGCDSISFAADCGKKDRALKGKKE
jgi:hypothetical protein